MLRLVAQPSVISGTTVLTQLPGQGVTTRRDWKERLKRKRKKKKKRRNASRSRRAFPGFTVWWLFFATSCVVEQKDALWSLAAAFLRYKCRTISSISLAILSATAMCCNLHKFWPSARHAAAVMSLDDVESQPHSCDLTMLDDTPNDTPSLQRIASTMDLLAILHSHKIAHNITSIAFLKRKKKKK